MGKKNVLLEKIKKIRRDQWIVLLLAGVLLAVISLPAPQGAGREDPADAQTEQDGAALQDVFAVERRLESILCQMDGAGDVRVMITQKDSGEKIVEKDVSSVSRSTQEQDGSGTGRSTSEREDQETTVYGQGGSGSGAPYVTQELAPQVEGVLVLAEGAGDANVKKDITDAVMALFGLEAHKIKVMKMNERRG